MMILSEWNGMEFYWMRCDVKYTERQRERERERERDKTRTRNVMCFLPIDEMTDDGMAC